MWPVVFNHYTKPHNQEMSTSSVVNIFVHAICKHSKKYFVQKVAHFGSLGPIPVIQPPFNSSCVALQYEPGIKFFHRMIISLLTLSMHVHVLP